MGPRDISKNVVEGTDNWRVLALNWLFHQGVSTVLLVAVVYGLWEGIPQLLDQHRQENREARNDFKLVNESQRQDFKEELQKIREDYKAVGDATRDTQKEMITILRHIDDATHRLYGSPANNEQPPSP